MKARIGWRWVFLGACVVDPRSPSLNKRGCGVIFGGGVAVVVLVARELPQKNEKEMGMNLVMAV